jgi:hypothetical protein
LLGHIGVAFKQALLDAVDCCHGRVVQFRLDGHASIALCPMPGCLEWLVALQPTVHRVAVNARLACRFRDSFPQD